MEKMAEIQKLADDMAKEMHLEVPAKKYQSFEDFLEDKHGEDYMGTDDDMPDAYENWMSNLDVQEVIDYAEEWGKVITF